MKQLISTLLLTLMVTLNCMAQEYDEYQKIKVWDNSTAPHSNGLTGEEKSDDFLRIENVSTAELYMYYPEKGKSTGQAVLVCPGGGYRMVAFKHEGLQVARWLAKNGITAAVLKYRMPNKVSDIPLEDAKEALRIVRGLATEHDFSADSVGIMGFSAGGHLAATASTLLKGEDAPDFSILTYALVSVRDIYAHKGSLEQLLGDNASQEEIDRFSADLHVDANTPPTFLALSDDDKVVTPINALCYYEALKRNKIASSMHIYPTGGHGWGMLDNFSYGDQWRSALLDWLGTLK